MMQNPLPVAAPVTQSPAGAWARRALPPLGLGIVVLALSYGSIMLTRQGGGIAMVWPANGLVLAMLLRAPTSRGRVLFAAALLGNLAANLLAGDPLPRAITFMGCNGLEIGLAALLIRKWRGVDFDVTSLRDLLLLAVVAGVGAPLTASLTAAGIGEILTHPAAGPPWRGVAVWMAADGVGMMIVAPLALVLMDLRRHLRETPLDVKGGAALAFLVLLTAVVFSRSAPGAFLIPPALLLVAFQLEMLGATVGLVLVAAIALASTLSGLGPMGPLAGDALFKATLMQFFLLVMALASLPTAAVLRQRRRLQATLESQLRWMRLAEDVAGVGRWRLEVATRKITWSPAMFRMFGLEPAAEPPLETLMEMIHPEDRAEADGLLDRALTQGEDCRSDLRLLHPGGTMCHVQGSATVERGRDGAIIAVLGTLVDVTGLKRAEAAIADSERRFRSLADNASDIVMKTDASGTLTYISPSMQALTGHEPAALIGGKTLNIVHPDDAARVQAMAAACVRSGGRIQPPRMEFRTVCTDGRVLWLESRPMPEIDEATGRVTALTDIARDITERKALEAELRAARAEAEAAAAVKSEFLANMSHELRTPLTSVLGFTRLALEQDGLPAAVRGYIGKAATAGTALLTTVNDILDFSSLEAGQVEIRPQPTDVAALARETLELFRERAADSGLELRLDLHGLPERLAVDPDRLRQILLNLIGNAVKFCDAGSVTLSASWDAVGARLAVTVADTGPGLSTEQQQLLFRRFSQVDASSTRRHGGTGLGLAICMGLVEAMGGEIGVASSPGQGACFFFDLPAPRANYGAVDADGDPVLFPVGARVLVADDHAVNRELVTAILAPLGARVTGAACGEDAVALAMQEPYDLILMDLRMPGLDGHGALRAIRQGGGPNCNAPILAFSAGADTAGEEERRAAGFDGDLAKPVMPAALVAAIVRHMAPAWPSATGA